MEPVDHVYFGQGLIGALPQLVPGLLERHRVGPGIAGLKASKRAEEAACDADVGRLEADVEVVVRAGAVALLALPVREPAQREEIGTLEEPHAIVERQPLAAVQLVRDPAESQRAQSSVHRKFLCFFILAHMRLSPLTRSATDAAPCRRMRPKRRE
jgi:hypothetical protein